MMAELSPASIRMESHLGQATLGKSLDALVSFLLLRSKLEIRKEFANFVGMLGSEE